MTISLPILLLFLTNFACGQDITRIETDAAAALRDLPGVASVQVRHAVPVPTRRIIHVLNYHYVSKKDYAADLLDEDPKTTQAEIDENYARLVATVKAVQKDQRAMLDLLTGQHGLQNVYLEGVTEQNVPVVEATVFALNRIQRRLKRLKSEGADVEDRLQELEESVLYLGAAGKLCMDGTLKILPAERHEVYEAANPVTADGAFELDERKQQAREDAIVGNLLKDEVAVVILGTAHDLTDNIKRLAPNCEYVVVRVKALPEAD